MGIGLSESAPEMKVIDAWLEKLDKCKSEQLTSATVCLSKNYKGKMCNPDEPKTIEEPKEEKPKEEKPKEEKPKEEKPKEEEPKEEAKEEKPKDPKEEPKEEKPKEEKPKEE